MEVVHAGLGHSHEGQVTVYVDNMRARYRRMIMCHMIADTEQELHTMAQVIGVARRWYQGDHYDICLSKRALAVKLGAVQLSRMDLGRIVIARRKREREQAVQHQHLPGMRVDTGVKVR